MTDAATPPSPPQKSVKRAVLIGLVLAILGGGAGFYAVTRGLVAALAGPHESAETPASAMPDVAILEVEPILVTLSPESRNRHLRFRTQLEVAKPHANEVQTLMPRIVDVMNSYLRALEPADFEDPQVLPRLRSQLLRRIQVVTGQGRVKDLLVMEFVLN